MSIYRFFFSVENLFKLHLTSLHSCVGKNQKQMVCTMSNSSTYSIICTTDSLAHMLNAGFGCSKVCFLLLCTWYNTGIPPSDTFIPLSRQTMARRLSRGGFALLLEYSNNSGCYITITVSLYGEKVSYLKVCAPPLCPLTFI